MDPVLAGCFPGTPIFGADLLQGDISQQRIWFRTDYLEDLRILRKNSPRVAVTGLVNAMFERHADKCGSNLPSIQTVYHQLNKSLEEYENVKFLEAKELSSIADGSEGGLLCSCPACLQTVEIVGKYLLALLQKANAQSSIQKQRSLFTQMSSIVPRSSPLTMRADCLY